MRSEWQLQEAKNNLSQLIKQAASGDAQVVTVHGKPPRAKATAVTFFQDGFLLLENRVRLRG